MKKLPVISLILFCAGANGQMISAYAGNGTFSLDRAFFPNDYAKKPVYICEW